MRAAVLAGILGLSAVGWAQVKPYIIFDIDTSGSMGYDTCGNGGPILSGWDDTTECPGVDQTCAGCNASGCGNGVADDGRLWKVKKGTSEVVNSFGEVTYALARFSATPVSNFTCDAGGWAGDCSGADILVPFYEGNQQDVLEWMDYDDNYPGTCIRGTLFPPTTSTGCPPATGCSLCADCGGGCDKELRPGNGTPIGNSLTDVEAYLSGVMATDPVAACRPYVAITLTDGDDTCGGLGVATAAAASVCNDLGVPVYVVGFASPLLQANLDAIADAGCDTACNARGCRDTAIMVDNETDLALAFADIVQGALLFEKCNGLDDNCNGLTDEDFPGLGDPCCNPCNGRIVCNAAGDGTICNGFGPCNEVCNARDDDCDGLIDEGLDCQYEVCNGIDDDGDGMTDELPLPGLGQPCGTDEGECNIGVSCCDEGAFACCGADPPTQEACNCKDDNCNGLTDEAGSRRCYAGPPSECPDPEGGRCNGICQPGVQACVTTGCPGSPGYGACVGEIGPRPESCNCLDDNCNGFVDDGAICPNGAACTNCGCPNICDPTAEFPCPAGYVCSGRCPDSPEPAVCLADPCLGSTCPLGQQCNECTGACDDLCEGVDCGEGRTCCASVCCDTWEVCQDANADGLPTCDDLTCSNPAFACAEGEVCKDHVCVGDPCSGMDCGGQGCVDGTCFPVCPHCRDDERCADGQCVIDPCAGASCVGADVICCDGVCQNDPCAASSTCSSGEYCDGCQNICREDVCPRVHCPSGYECRRGQCEPPGNLDSRITDVAAAGAGGCQCTAASVPAGPQGSWVALCGLLVLASVRARRRR